MRAGLPDAVRGAATARDGVVLVDKPAGPTSHDVVALTRSLAATRRVGHAGTLDPAATGLLVLGVGRATRLLTYFVGADKTYEATVRLGQDTLTEDAEGEVTASRGCPNPEAWPGGHGAFAARLEEAMGSLTGRIAQVPSAVSAIRVDGVRSYARVRGGEDVVLPARSVTVHRLTRLGAPVAARAADGTAVVDLRLRVSCSSGTYVRALARDLGAALATGAHLTALRRTRVGPFTIDEARGPRDMVSQVTADAAGPEPEGLSTLSPSTVVRRVLPAVELDRDQSAAVRYGRSLPEDVLDRAVMTPGEPMGAVAAGEGAGPHPDAVAGFAPDGDVVALLTRKGGRARPVLVLSPA